MVISSNMNIYVNSIRINSARLYLMWGHSGLYNYITVNQGNWNKIDAKVMLF